MCVHELDFFVDVVILWSNWATSRSAFCVFGGEYNQAESGRWREGPDIGDAGAGFQELDVGGWVDMGVDVHNGRFGGSHSLRDSLSVTVRTTVGEIRGYKHPVIQVRASGVAFPNW